MHGFLSSFLILFLFCFSLRSFGVHGVPDNYLEFDLDINSLIEAGHERGDDVHVRFSLGDGITLCEKRLDDGDGRVPCIVPKEKLIAGRNQLHATIYSAKTGTVLDTFEVEFFAPSSVFGAIQHTQLKKWKKYVAGGSLALVTGASVFWLAKARRIPPPQEFY